MSVFLTGKRSLLGVTVFLLTSIPLAAATINFDAFAPGTNIDGLNLGGVTLTTGNGSTQTISNGGVGYISAPNAVTTDGFMQGNFLVMTFDIPQISVQLTGGDRGGDSDQFVMRAYDTGGLLLGSVTTPVFGGNPSGGPTMQDYFTQTISFAGMKRVEVQSVINAGIGIDDLVFSAVPEPAAVLLVGTGLLAAALLRRFRRA